MGFCKQKKKKGKVALYLLDNKIVATSRKLDYA
jgi:hypothetical protein